MLTALTILLVRQYRKAGSRQEFFKWLFQNLHLYAFRIAYISLAFFLVVASLKA